jgi:hypothetical protein
VVIAVHANGTSLLQALPETIQHPLASAAKTINEILGRCWGLTDTFDQLFGQSRGNRKLSGLERPLAE